MSLQKQVRTHRFDFRVLFEPSKDIEGQWVAHCLNLDVVSQGNSLMHARDMLIEAVRLSIMDDIEADRNILDRRSAPKEYWDKFERVVKNGKPIKLSEVIAKGSITLATFISITFVGVQASETRGTDIPPAWLIGAMGRSTNRLHA